MQTDTTILFRPVEKGELDLIEQADWKQFPLCPSNQPIFHIFSNQEYAEQLARDWHTEEQARDFVGYVIQFSVKTSHLSTYEIHPVGAQGKHQDYWIPAERLQELNEHIVGSIKVESLFRREHRKILFIFTNAFDHGKTLELKGPWSDKFLEEIPNDCPIDVVLKEVSGWSPDTDMSFLALIPRLRSLLIIIDGRLNPLPQLPTLENLSLQYKSTEFIDFKRYTNLTACSIPWSKQTEGILSCKSLRKLKLWHLPFENLEPLSELRNLEELSIIQWRRLSSITPINRFSELKSLQLAYLPKLEQIGELADCSKLESLEIVKCKRLTSTQPLAKLQALKKLILEDCADIDSLAPLVNCNSLQYLSFGGSTNIVDGDIGVLLKNRQISHLHFCDRKHYSHGHDEWHAERFQNTVWTQKPQLLPRKGKKS